MPLRRPRQSNHTHNSLLRHRATHHNLIVKGQPHSTSSHNNSNNLLLSLKDHQDRQRNNSNRIPKETRPLDFPLILSLPLCKPVPHLRISILFSSRRVTAHKALIPIHKNSLPLSTTPLWPNKIHLPHTAHHCIPKKIRILPAVLQHNSRLQRNNNTTHTLPHNSHLTLLSNRDMSRQLHQLEMFHPQ